MKTTTLATKTKGNFSPISLRHQTADDLLNYFNEAWNLYEKLFSAINKEEAYYLAPDPLRNPLIFYYGHTAAFYINKMVLAGLIPKGINSRFEDIFAKGVDPSLEKGIENKEIWPSVEEVRNYRSIVYNTVINVIKGLEFPEHITSEHPIWNIHMGIEHDYIHFETSSVLFRLLDEKYLEKPENWNYAPTNGYIEEFKLEEFEGGKVTIGKQDPSRLYGWDNEYGTKTINVKPFAVTRQMITNGEYLHFVKSGANNKEQY